MAPYANRCYLPVEHSLVVPSIVRAFAKEFELHFRRGCESCRTCVVPQFVDFDEQVKAFVYARPSLFAGKGIPERPRDVAVR